MRWSPDSRKLAWSDKTGRLYWCDVTLGRVSTVDKDDRRDILEYEWSPDSRWIVYTKHTPSFLGRLHLYSLTDQRITAVTDGISDDFSPSFDPGGRWLYFVSWRTLTMDPGHFENQMAFMPSARVYALSLASTTPPPVRTHHTTDDSLPPPETATNTRIDLDGLADRIIEMPIPADDIMRVKGTRSGLVFTARDQVPDESEAAPVTLFGYDLATQHLTPIVHDADEPFVVSDRGDCVLYRRGGSMALVDVDREHAATEGALPTEDLMAWVDPRAEWRQIYDEVWRMARDFFYDPAMTGLDWKAIGDRYRALLPYVSHRMDLNYVLAEMLGELSTSHIYVSGGDMPQTPEVNIGLLGVDWRVDAKSGVHRFDHIYREHDWNAPVTPPLAEPGLDVHEGDYLLAVNGRPVRLPTCVFEPFGGTVGHPTELLIGRTPDDPKPHTIVVTPIADEMPLRYAAWVRAKRDRVARETGGAWATSTCRPRATTGSPISRATSTRSPRSMH
jgi:tricorn protease